MTYEESVEAQKHFRRIIKGRNFMTPHTVEFGWIIKDKVAYELSRGEGIEHDEIFGVTLAHNVQEDRKADLNQCFCGKTAKNDAISYIVRLKNSQEHKQED